MAGIEGSDTSVREKVSTETYPGSKMLVEHPQTDTLIRKCYPGIHSLYDELKRTVSGLGCAVCLRVSAGG